MFGHFWLDKRPFSSIDNKTDKISRNIINAVDDKSEDKQCYMYVF